MKTAVVILNWNGQHMLRRYLPTLIRHTEEAEIIVADNASTDDSMQMMQAEFPGIRTIVLDKNYGFAEGYNRALAEVEAEYYVLLNSDVEVTAHWLSPLTAHMDSHPEVAACQPRLLSTADHTRYEYAGAAGGYIDRYGYPFCRGRIFSTVEKDHGQYDNVAEVAWATGACLLVRSKDYRGAGGLDGRFFAHNEEIDLCWRLRLQGRKICCVPESRVYHVGGGTLPKNNPQKTYLNFRNNLTMLYKNLPEAELRHVMRVRRWLDYLAAAEMLLIGGGWGDFRAVLRGRKDFLRWRHQFDADRERIQRGRKTDEVRTPCSILWQYYVRGRKTYSSLGVKR